MFVDSHCHLSFPELHDRVDEIRARDGRAPASTARCASAPRWRSSTRVHALAMAHDNFWCTRRRAPRQRRRARARRRRPAGALRGLPRVVAIGETGLDYYRLNGRSVAEMEWQRERFRVHIRAARATRPAAGRPHPQRQRRHAGGCCARRAQGGVRGVFHCFTETLAVARAALDLGFHISFSGILTFRNAEELREVARVVPLERCLIETDSPYLAPVPLPRQDQHAGAGCRTSPPKLAELKGLDVEQVAEATTQSFERLFGVRLPVPTSSENLNVLA
ncbi:MAG: TatD family hydrolase [Comamonadaceae bacterium]|nr:TatD family hydrolase [Comamonadaceae bacterium]